MKNPMSLEGQRVLVTGASSGLGRDAAMMVAEMGGAVVLVGRDQTRLHETLTCLPGTGHVAESFDLTDLDAIEPWLRNLAKSNGPISSMVHCAGVQWTLPIRSVPISRYLALMRVNVDSAYALTKALRHPSVRQKDTLSIVYISSVMGIVGNAGQSAYCTSKSALIGLTKALAVELARENVRVNAVLPGLVAEGMGVASEQTLPEAHMELIRRHPFGIGNSRDVSNAVAFLLSASSRWITGTTLVVDGGYTAA